MRGAAAGMSLSQLFQKVPSVHVASDGCGGAGGGGTGKTDVLDEPYAFAMRPASRALEQ